MSDLDRQRRAKQGLAARNTSDTPLSWRRATVVAVGSGSVDLTFDDDEALTPPWTGVRYLASYSPAQNDKVEVLDFGTDLLVLGKRA